MKELNIIQTQLNAPKGQLNSFGGYKYRSLEDIMQAVKPLLITTQCTITFADRVELIGTRYYVHTVCKLRNASGETEVSEAYAREQEQKKGMDEAQITGSASSYARKYAACSLLAIDDNLEPDMVDNREEGQKKAATRPVKDAAAPAPAKPRITTADGPKMTQLAEWYAKQTDKAAAVSKMMEKYDLAPAALQVITSTR